MRMIQRNSSSLAQALRASGFMVTHEDGAGAIVVGLPTGYVIIVGISSDSEIIVISYQIPVADPDDAFLEKFTQSCDDYPGVKIIGGFDDDGNYFAKIQVMVYSGDGIPFNAVIHALGFVQFVATRMNIA